MLYLQFYDYRDESIFAKAIVNVVELYRRRARKTEDFSKKN